MSPILEICCFNLPSALIAQEAGAQRVELCASPDEGGVTPSAGLIRTARECLHIDLYPIIRPRGGDFLFSDEEYRIMLRDVELCRKAGCNGIVIGLLNADGTIDKDRSARLVELAYPMGVTFHRAFDHSASPHQALEDIIGTGCERILSSGQRPKAAEGVLLLKELIVQADQRIIIMPGSGIRASNLAEIRERTGATEFHSSARTNRPGRMEYINPAMNDDLSGVMADGREIREMRSQLGGPAQTESSILPS
jgi:copper homeostasis protein